jgi:hypothetical protein
LENANDPGTIMTPPPVKPSGIGAFTQIAALVVAIPAIVCGVFVVWSSAFPPPCGDFSGVVALGVVECWVVDLPVGLLVLAIGLSVKTGRASLRKICIWTSFVILSLPIIATGIFQMWHCH